ncbi:prolyl oligopeptidase family serine peptidase [Streptomyces sp. ME19-03-3]|nr:prolyl oligopeptidase family serine peptidase [Streptomyces sp. ME19-03-3]
MQHAWKILESNAEGDTVVLSSRELPGGPQLSRWITSPGGGKIATILTVQDQHSLVVKNLETGNLEFIEVDLGTRQLAWNGEDLVYIRSTPSGSRLLRWTSAEGSLALGPDFDGHIVIADSIPGRLLLLLTDGHKPQASILHYGLERQEIQQILGPMPGSFARFFNDGSVAIAFRDNAGSTIFAKCALPHLRPSLQSTLNLDNSSRIVSFLTDGDDILVALRDLSKGGLSLALLDWTKCMLRPLETDGQLQAISLDRDSGKILLTERFSPTIIQLAEARRHGCGLSYSPPWREVLQPSPSLRSEFTFEARDGTTISVSAENLAPASDAPRPLLLSVYGGFGVSMALGGRHDMNAWALAGGAHAVAHVRGGGEGGPDWHRAGRRRLKINAITDTIDAARWLIEQGYASPESLAIGGASNGGLIASAAAIMAPDLFRACVVRHPVVDPFDPDSASREAWLEEYGNPLDPLDRTAVEAYAPLSNLRAGTCYPAFLIMVGLKDRRVPSRHARRLAERLRQSTSSPLSTHPVILYVSPEGGHFGPSQRDSLDWHTNRLLFLAQTLNLEVQP